MPPSKPRRRYPNIEPMGTGWRATVSIDGKMRKGKTRETQAEAHADAEGLRTMREAGQGETMAATLGEACTQVLALCGLRKRRGGTESWYRCHFATLKREFDEGTKLLTIDRAAVQRLVDRRVAAGISPRTIRHELQALRRCFRVAQLPPPTNDARLILPDLKPKAIDVFEWHEVTDLLAKVREADEFEWATLAFFFYTGIRRTEAARIRIVDDVHDIDWGKKVLHVKIGKKRPRSLPCPDKLMELLSVFNDGAKRPKKEEDGDGLFPGATVDQRVNYIYNVFRYWGTKLGLKKLHPHACRHTFGSELARRGASVPTIARLMGHDLSSDTITSLYVTPHDPELRAAMGLLWETPKATAKKRKKGHA